jgi:predicted permease
LKQGVTIEQAAAALNPLYSATLNEVEAPLLANVTEQQREAFRSRQLVLEPGERGQTRSEILSPARHSLELLLAASGAVLLLCCANVAGLILLRATTRSGEIAVRASLGATAARLASLQLAESLVLALPAALLSLPVAWLTLRGARQVPGIPAAAPDVGLSGAAALVAIGVAVAAALTLGLLPVRGLTRAKPGNALQAHGARHTATKSVARFRTALATVQVALSMALLALMGVFAQSLANIGRLDPGVNVDSVVMFSIPPPNGIQTLADSIPRVRDALEAIPGVSAVSWSLRPLFSTGAAGVSVFQASVEGNEAEPLATSSDIVSSNFFRTFGVELLAGREFNETDKLDRAIVNQRFAEHFGLSADDIVGRTILIPSNLPGARPIGPKIVGVVADMRSGKVTKIEPRMFTVAAEQKGLTYGGAATLYVRGTRPPADLIGAVRETIARLDTTMAITNLRTVEEQLRDNSATERFVAAAATAFAILATVLAALGLYGVLAYSVEQRTREIGLRVALGAPTDRIRRMVLRQVAVTAVLGVVLGMIAATLVGRAARALLFEVGAVDPLALATAVAVVALVALGAAYLPARRASRVDPMSVLRYE